jgi:uncharacterized protein
MDIPGQSELVATPTATKLALVAVLVTTAGLLVTVPDGHADTVLLVLTGLFGLRVAGQLLVLVRRPSWLPPMPDWNFVPYRILLPIQLGLLVFMGLVCTGERLAAVSAIAVPASFVYWGAMVLRYALRMWRCPQQRWFGGTIPIVFHCVLAAFLFELGAVDG